MSPGLVVLVANAVQLAGQLRGRRASCRSPSSGIDVEGEALDALRAVGAGQLRLVDAAGVGIGQHRAVSARARASASTASVPPADFVAA